VIQDTAITERLLNVNQAAAVLNVSTSWLYKAAERGELPCFRAGGLKFSRKQLAAWLNEQQKKTGRK
jgi:excisionase family DNA binding protein